jgi:hypothetical protein
MTWLKSNSSVTVGILHAGWSECEFDREHVPETMGIGEMNYEWI